MIEPETFTETVPADFPGAPNSWDPAGRDVPASKMDWLESLPFRQIRGTDIGADPENPYRLPGAPGEA